MKTDHTQPRFISLGVVGPGLVWTNAHEPILAARTEAIRIAAFCASSEETRRRVSRRYPDARMYSDSRRMMSSPDIDAVLVLTPLHLNAAMTIDALRAAKDVIVEKPLATSAGQAAMIAAEQERSRRKVFVLEQVLYTDFWNAIKAAAHEGSIGTPVFFDRVVHFRLQASHGAERGYGDTAWRIQPDFPFGALLDGGIHDIAVLSRLFGTPSTVRAQGKKYREQYGQFDHVIINLSYPSGIEGVFSHSAFLLGSRNYFHIRGTEGLISVEGNTATVESTRAASRKILDGAQHHENAWNAAIEYLLHGVQPAYSISQAQEDLRILDAIGKSITVGGPVSLDG